MVTPLNSSTNTYTGIYPTLSPGMESDQYSFQGLPAHSTTVLPDSLTNRFAVRADVQESTKELLNECRKIASLAKGVDPTLLASEERQAGVNQNSRFPHIHIIHTPAVNLFSSAPRVIVERQVSVQEYEYNKRVAAVGLGALLAGITAFILGLAKAQYEKSQRKEFAPLEHLKGIWEQNRSDYQAYVDYQHKIDSVVKKSFDILNRKQSAQLYKIAYLVSLVVSGALCVAGGIVASGSLIGGGIGLGLFSSILMLGRLGYNFFNEEDGEDADSIEMNLHTLEQKRIPTIITPTAPELA